MWETSTPPDFTVNTFYKIG